MKVFAYSVREDEVKYVEEFKNAQNISCDYVSEYPSMDNVNLAAGYDAVSVITNVITPEMYEAWAKMDCRYGNIVGLPLHKKGSAIFCYNQYRL